MCDVQATYLWTGHLTYASNVQPFIVEASVWAGGWLSFECLALGYIQLLIGCGFI